MVAVFIKFIENKLLSFIWFCSAPLQQIRTVLSLLEQDYISDVYENNNTQFDVDE